jgi:hypothetical protein
MISSLGPNEPGRGRKQKSLINSLTCHSTLEATTAGVVPLLEYNLILEVMQEKYETF